MRKKLRHHHHHSGSGSVVDAAVAQRRLALATGTVVPSLRPRGPPLPTGGASDTFSAGELGGENRVGPRLSDRAARHGISMAHFYADDVPPLGNCLFWCISVMLGTVGGSGGWATPTITSFSTLRDYVASYLEGTLLSARGDPSVPADAIGSVADPYHPDGPIRFAYRMMGQIEAERAERRLPEFEVIEQIHAEYVRMDNKARERAEKEGGRAADFFDTPDFTEAPFRQYWPALRKLYAEFILRNYTIAAPGVRERGVWSSELEVELCSEVFGAIIHLYDSRFTVEGDKPDITAARLQAIYYPKMEYMRATLATKAAQARWDLAFPGVARPAEGSKEYEKLKTLYDETISKIPHWHIVLHGGHYYPARPVHLSDDGVAHPWHHKFPAGVQPAPLLGWALPWRPDGCDLAAPPPPKLVDPELPRLIDDPAPLLRRGPSKEVVPPAPPAHQAEIGTPPRGPPPAPPAPAPPAPDAEALKEGIRALRARQSAREANAAARARASAAAAMVVADGLTNEQAAAARAAAARWARSAGTPAPAAPAAPAPARAPSARDDGWGWLSADEMAAAERLQQEHDDAQLARKLGEAPPSPCPPDGAVREWGGLADELQELTEAQQQEALNALFVD